MSSKTATANEEKVRRFVTEAWNEGNMETVDEIYHPDYTGHWFLPGGGEATREDVKEFISGIRTGFPDYEMHIEFIHSTDDMVTYGFTGSGTHENEWMGIPPRDDPVDLEEDVPGQVTLRFEDGQAVEGWATWDAFGLFQNLGVIPEEITDMAPPADD